MKQQQPTEQKMKIKIFIDHCEAQLWGQNSASVRMRQSSNNPLSSSAVKIENFWGRTFDDLLTANI